MRKKHNAHKRLRRVANSMLRQNHVATVFVGGNNGYSHLVNHKTQQIITPSPSLVESMTKLGFQWSTFIAVMCKDEFGQEYMKAQQFDIDQQLKQSELAEYLNDQHFGLIKSCNSNHLINVGWISSPFPIEWEEKQVSEIFGLLGGWGKVPIQLMEKEVA